MKKLCLSIAAVMLLCGCSIIPSEPVAPQLTPLTYFDGKSLYEQYYTSNGTELHIVTRLDAATSERKPICSKNGCKHNNEECVAINLYNGCSLLGCYNNKLIFRDYTKDYSPENTEPTTTTIAVSDLNGKNYKIIGSVPGNYYSSDFNLYGDELIFSTNSSSTRIINSINLKNGKAKQITPQALPQADNYLCAYKDFVYYFNILNKDDRITYEIIKIDVTNGKTSTLCSIDQFTDPTIFNMTNHSFTYNNGKIYDLYTNTMKGTDILTEIDCLTGEQTVINDNIENLSPNGQRLIMSINDNLIIQAVENANDLPSDNAKVLAYNLSTKALTPITLTYESVDKSYTHQLYIRYVMGDNLMVNYKYVDAGIQTYKDENGKDIELPLYDVLDGIITVDDYLNSVPNYKQVTLNLK